jgi:hypothetical protein
VSVRMLVSAPAGTGFVFRAALIRMVWCSAFVQLLDLRAGGATEDGGPKSGRMRFFLTTQQVEILVSALICLLWWGCNSSHSLSNVRCSRQALFGCGFAAMVVVCLQLNSGVR